MTNNYQMELSVGDDRMVKFEMEAVEALATLAGCSAVRGGVSGLGEKLVRKPIVTRTPFSQAEQEARKVRRVLANRESARQTIRRRQAMHLELIRKAAVLSQENEILKEGLAVKEYNSLKRRNEFLKLQMVNIKKAEPTEIPEETKSSHAELATSTISSPGFLHDQPSLVPLFCPFVQPSNVKYAYHSDVMSSSSHLRREISLGITGPGNPLFVLPVPWLLPFPRYSATLLSYSDTNRSQNGAHSTHQCSISSSSNTLSVGDDHNMNMEMEVGSATEAGFMHSVDSSDHCKCHHPRVTLLMPEKSSCLGHVESIRPKGDSEEDSIRNVNAASATEHSSQTLLRKNSKTIICCKKRSENVFAATIARRKRKELMKLKNIKYHRVHSHNMEY